MEHRKARIFLLSKEIKELEIKINLLVKEKRELQFLEDKEYYNCPCVKYNKDLGIWNSSQQADLNRIGLQFGLVEETFSCEANCSLCKETGIIT